MLKTLKMSFDTQVNISNGVTIVASIDNILFPFATDFLVQYPISFVVSNVVGVGNLNGINVIKVSTNSATIQLYMFLVTGFTLQPLCYYQDISSNLNPLTSNITTNTNQSITNIKTETDVSKSSICFDGDDLDILDNDEEFADFDTFVAENPCLMDQC